MVYFYLVLLISSSSAVYIHLVVYLTACSLLSTAYLLLVYVSFLMVYFHLVLLVSTVIPLYFMYKSQEVINPLEFSRTSC